MCVCVGLCRGVCGRMNLHALSTLSISALPAQDHTDSVGQRRVRVAYVDCIERSYGKQR
jgi:hypothetical protein